MPQNSFAINQTCIFPNPLTLGKESYKKLLFLPLNFTKILELLAKDFTQYLLTYLARYLIRMFM